MKSIFQYHGEEKDSSFIVKEYYQPHFNSPFHYHDMYELILIYKSYGKLYAGNRVINFKQGEVFLFAPGFSHSFFNEKSFIASGEMAHAIVIFFKEDFLGNDFLQKSELSNISEMLKKSSYGVKIVNSTDRMIKTFRKMTLGGGMSALIALLKLLHKISIQPSENISIINHVVPKSIGDQKDADRLQAVFKYVIENFRENVNSSEAAALTHLNDAAFCRYFKRRTQKTFSQFVNNVRITHAVSLLKDTDTDIASICYECGFNNLSYFNRQFRLIMKQTPMEYRKTYLNVDSLLVAER